MFCCNNIHGIRGFGSVLGNGIIKGCLAIVGATSEVVGMDSRGTLYW
jgi:hypothetical protein